MGSPKQAPQALPPGEPEIKFYVPRQNTPALRSWLGMTLRQHPNHSVCTICSVYFDTAERTSLQEKAYSYYAKTKYRLRWYEDAQGTPLPVPAFIEIKAKQGSIRHKYRGQLPISPQQLREMPLDAPLFETLFRTHCPKPDWLPAAPLKPVLELRYQRDRFEHALFPETFCLDSHIRCTRTHPGVLPPALGIELAHDVFEQKGSTPDLAPVLRGLPRFGAQRASVSKYFLCITQLLPEELHA